MNDYEMIQAWKENLAEWQYVPDEMKKFSKKINKTSFVYLKKDGTWCGHIGDYFLNGKRRYTVYRLPASFDSTEIDGVAV